MRLETPDSNPYRLLQRSIPVVISPVEDARFEDLGKALGVEIDFAELMDADAGEILERQKLIRWLLQNDSLSAEFFTDTYDKPAGNKTLPDQSRNFMEYQHLLKQEQTNFWRRVTAFQEIAADSLYRTPKRIDNLSQVLTREGRIQYETEVELVDSMLTELRRIASLQGTLEVEINTLKRNEKPIQPTFTLFDKVPKWFGERRIKKAKIRDLDCYGLWAHHQVLDPHLLEVSPPVAAQLLRYVAPNRTRLADLIEALQHHRLVKPAQIKRTPSEIARDIIAHLNQLFSSDNFDIRAKFRLKILYSFDQDGLALTFLSWDLLNSAGHTLEVSEQQFEVGHLEYLHQKFTQKRDELARAYGPHRVYAELNEWLLAYTTKHIIDSPLTDVKFCHQRFPAVYLKFREQIEQVMAWQTQITAALDDLVLLRNAAVAVIEADLPYYFPELNTETAQLEAVDVYPIRVRKVPEKLIFPFDRISVNGQIVNWAGKNNSGKSIAALGGVLDVQVMAQCGLPVFARSGVVVYPRRFILMSFLDRSDESMYMAKLLKDKAIIEVINTIPRRDRSSVLVIIDELGSGTDQEEVFGVVRPFLDWLCRQQVSVLTSTQIRAVSNYIESDCGGENFIITPTFQIKKGVGSPEPQQLAKAIGFFESMTLRPKE